MVFHVATAEAFFKVVRFPPSAIIRNREKRSENPLLPRDKQLALLVMDKRLPGLADSNNDMTTIF